MDESAISAKTFVLVSPAFIHSRNVKDGSWTSLTMSNDGGGRTLYLTVSWLDGSLWFPPLRSEFK